MDFLKEYEILKSKKFPISETLQFSVELGKSDDIKLHFQLYCINQNNPRKMRGHPEDHFQLHGPAGIDYLRGLIYDPDSEKAINAAYLMAEIIRKLNWSGRAEAEQDLRHGLVLLSSNPNPKIRRKSIIAIGWIGTECEIPLLCNYLLNDDDALCRAWSASSFLQMNGRVPSDVMQCLTRDALIQCLSNEKDYFVCQVAVETCGDVWKKRISIRDADIENKNDITIAKIKKRAISIIQKSVITESEAE